MRFKMSELDVGNLIFIVVTYTKYLNHL